MPTIVDRPAVDNLLGMPLLHRHEELVDAIDGMDHYRGWFIDSAALIAAHPTGAAGDYATVGKGATGPVIWAWDTDTNAWENTASSGLVQSVFLRTGNVAAQAGDYAAFYDVIGAGAAAVGAHLIAFNHGNIHVRSHALDGGSDHSGTLSASQMPTTGTWSVAAGSTITVQAGDAASRFQVAIPISIPAATPGVAVIQTVGLENLLMGAATLPSTMLTPYSPAVPADWPEGVPTQILGALDTLATRQLAVNVNYTNASNTLALTDAGKVVWLNRGTAISLSIPLDVTVNFPVNTMIQVVQEGLGAATIAAVAGVTLNGVTPGSGQLWAQYSAVTLVKRSANNWVVFGAIGIIV